MDDAARALFEATREQLSIESALRPICVERMARFNQEPQVEKFGDLPLSGGGIHPLKIRADLGRTLFQILNS